MALTVKLNTMAGLQTTIATADFFRAITRARNNSNTIVIKGVQYDLTSLVFDEATSVTIKGDVDYSSNPNYLSASAGDIYRASVAGKIGGASGKDIGKGDLAICLADSAAGNEAAVGANWSVLQSKVDNEKLVYVDGTNGSDTTGAVYNQSRPFATITAAIAAAAAGDTIIVKPATYTTDTSIGSTKAINIICEEGVIFNCATGTPTFAPAANRLRVYGSARFTGSDQVLSINSATADVNFEFDEIAHTCTSNSIQVTNYLKLYLKGNTISNLSATAVGAIRFSGDVSGSLAYIDIKDVSSAGTEHTINFDSILGKIFYKGSRISGAPTVNGNGVIETNATGAISGIITMDVDLIAQTAAANTVHAIVLTSGTANVYINARKITNACVLGSGCNFISGVNTLRVDDMQSEAKTIICTEGTNKVADSNLQTNTTNVECIRHTAGKLRLSNTRVFNNVNGAASHGIFAVAAGLILDDVTIVTTNGGVNSVTNGGAAVTVKTYSVESTMAYEAAVVEAITGAVKIVDADVE